MRGIREFWEENRYDMSYVWKDSFGCCVENKLQRDKWGAAGGKKVKDGGESEQESSGKEDAKCQGLDIFWWWSPKDFLAGAD